MRVKNIVAGFVLAVVAIGAFLTTPVGAQQIMRIYGTTSGTPIALLATAGGVLRVSLDGGTVTSLTFPASTCAAPAINETGALTTGIAFTAVPSILECVSGTARGTWAATGLTTAVPIFVTPLSRSAYAFQVFDPTDASSAIELYVGGTGNGNLYINDGAGAAVYSFESTGIATLGAAAGNSYLQVQRSGQIMTINPDYATLDTYSAIATNNNIGMKLILNDGVTPLVGLQLENTGVVNAPGWAITSGVATGLTINSVGALARQVYKVTVDRTAFVCAAVTCDVTIGTLPAKTSVLSVYGQLATVFACTATCTSATLSMVLGVGAGGDQYLASFDADAATAIFGDADAELGTTMTRAAAIQGGNAVPAFASTTTLVVRLTSGTGNIGNGSATNLSTGSITFYVVTERLP